jgi:GT2 family glycosyltransferase
MKIVVVTICYSSIACIHSLSAEMKNSRHEVECVLYLHSRRPDVERVCAEFAGDERVQYHAWGVNRGVSTSWNEGILTAQSRGADVTIVANDDIAFAPGDVDKLSAHATAHRSRYIISCAGTHLGFGRRVPSMGYSCFAINPVAIEKLGCFDENLFPAYCEDQDYAYRAGLAGLQEENCADTALTHQGSASLSSDRQLLYQNAVTQQKNMLYYRQKWGGFAGAEVYQVPFNNPRLSIRIAPETRERPYGPNYDRQDRHIVRV